jgi:hypothetical protein
MASLLQIGTVSKNGRMMNALLALIKVAVLVYFILYAIYADKPRHNMKAYHDLLLPALIAVFLFASPITTVLVLVMWAIRLSCKQDVSGLLIATIVVLSIEIAYQVGVVVTGKVALGVVGPASMRLGMGVVGRSKASRLSLRA